MSETFDFMLLKPLISISFQKILSHFHSFGTKLLLLRIAWFKIKLHTF